MQINSGLTEAIPYSLSRWTDVSASPDKWAWFKDQLTQGYMVAFDPRTGVPSRWSLKPEDSLGLVIWTKNPTNLLREVHLLEGHRIKLHVTATGWSEVEKNAPNLRHSGKLLLEAANALGAENVTWRFSPVPVVPDTVARFQELAAMAEQAGVKSVYLSFLQPNDRIPETRSREERLELLLHMAQVGSQYGIAVKLCNEDSLLARVSELPENLSTGVCAPPEDFGQASAKVPPSEGCGCVLMIDPFTVNESCSLGCKYCYAADVSSAPKKRNTTRSLPVLR